MNDWKPTASLNLLKQRAKMLADIRAFFAERNVLEVETPALSQAANTDPYIESFSLDSGQRFLHTSPEYGMKRLLAAGSGDIYQICKVWRDEEAGRYHNPEFTLLEYYRIGFSYQQLMQELEFLLITLLMLKKPANYSSYQQLFIELLQLDPHKADHSTLIDCARKNIPELEMGDESSWQKQDLLDVLLTHCIEPSFANDRLTFVYDYPVTQSALANIRGATQTEVALAERFEVYYGSVELANGYQELTNARKNAEVIETELHTRKQQQKKEFPKDAYFLQAMESGMPSASGVAIGLDRLLMCATGQKKIQQVISFPWGRA
ncbi:MAG: EF-P lysine aminoacylase GenX [Cocleimonas sp.]|nr:EF-P lysine aminoacylase GenX [Cocleimonas sp.]